jgi:hypothetical protein
MIRIITTRPRTIGTFALPLPNNLYGYVHLHDQMFTNDEKNKVKSDIPCTLAKIRTSEIDGIHSAPMLISSRMYLPVNLARSGVNVLAEQRRIRTPEILRILQ